MSFYRVTIISESEETRTLVFEAKPDEDIEKTVREIADGWKRYGYNLDSSGPLGLGDTVMELVTV